MVELPKDDFLSKLTFEEIFNFLFDNNTFFDIAKDVVYQKDQTVVNRCLSKAELLKRIGAIEERTIWKVIFAPLFPNSVIPKMFDDIHEYRNRIMHIRDLDYKNYDTIRRAYKKCIKELEQNLSKGLVADDSKDNVRLVAESFMTFLFYKEQLLLIQFSLKIVLKK